MIPVTKPFLPPKEEVFKLLDEVWQRQWLTNNGPLVNELELKLKEYLDLPHLLYLNNGTIALQIAIKSLELKGEIITTPFSYVATTSSIVWEGCKPVFVDIDPETFNIDPAKIESAISGNTSAILATHVFGNPCDIDVIEIIAKKYNLKVIYDAAHCFGTIYKGKSIFSYGDISTTSFHATKLFHTVEGGAVFSQNSDLIKVMAYMRNFGHDGPDRFFGLGINGKNSEFHAAMGLVNLNYVANILEKRKIQSNIYNTFLKGLPIQYPSVSLHAQINFAYYPIVFESEEVTLKIKRALELNNIFPRRYFYPSLSSLNYLNGEVTPIADSISSRILCLPLYQELTEAEQKMIAQIIFRNQNS
jgi:dTDP-4-amino-4,6-dideoxygalactose transaminase